MGKKISIYIENDELIKDIKKAAKDEGRSMTRYLEFAAREKIERKRLLTEAGDAA